MNQKQPARRSLSSAVRGTKTGCTMTTSIRGLLLLIGLSIICRFDSRPFTDAFASRTAAAAGAASQRLAAANRRPSRRTGFGWGYRQSRRRTSPSSQPGDLLSSCQSNILSWISSSSSRRGTKSGFSNERLSLASASSFDNVQGQKSALDEMLQDDQGEYTIREATFGDLPHASRILVESFYDATPLFRHYHKLKELDRLQSNFPYDNSLHSMYVACSRDDPDHVIAFADIDGRPTERRYAPPRPYLSDLAVHPDWRRRGIARALILMCERKAESYGYRTLHLRVKFDNANALAMYGSLGYDVKPHSYFGVKDDTLLLQRELKERRLLSGGDDKGGDSEEALAKETGSVDTSDGGAPVTLVMGDVREEATMQNCTLS